VHDVDGGLDRLLSWGEASARLRGGDEDGGGSVGDLAVEAGRVRGEFEPFAFEVTAVEQRDGPTAGYAHGRDDVVEVLGKDGGTRRAPPFGLLTSNLVGSRSLVIANSG
jgi:hypothetical protein